MASKGVERRCICYGRANPSTTACSLPVLRPLHSFRSPWAEGKPTNDPNIQRNYHGNRTSCIGRLVCGSDFSPARYQLENIQWCGVTALFPRLLLSGLGLRRSLVALFEKYIRDAYGQPLTHSYAAVHDRAVVFGCIRWVWPDQCI